jgi:hypothetical protein
VATQHQLISNNGRKTKVQIPQEHSADLKEATAKWWKKNLIKFMPKNYT